jgi:hypothetical protein
VVDRIGAGVVQLAKRDRVAASQSSGALVHRRSALVLLPGLDQPNAGILED